MLTLNTTDGVARDLGRIYKYAGDGEQDDGRDIVVTFTIGDDNDLVIEYPDERGNDVSIFVPLERLKKLIETV